METAPRVAYRLDVRVTRTLRSLFLSASLGALIPVAGSVCATEFCSCIGGGGRFLVMNGATIPLDSRGIPWSGFISYNDNHEPVLPAATGFTIERVTPSGRTGVGVELELLTGPLVGDERFSRPLLLVKPRGGFSTHAQYVFTDHGGHSGRFLRGAPRQVVVNVSDRRLLDGSDTASAELVATEQTRGELRVMATGGSCSIAIDAAQTRLELRLGGDLNQWRDVLLFSTSVDGELWRPRSSVCSQVAPGESWTGRGTDRVFADCTPDHPYGGPDFKLEQGRREVTVTAWWPGVASISGTTEVVLSCSGDLR